MKVYKVYYQENKEVYSLELTINKENDVIEVFNKCYQGNGKIVKVIKVIWKKLIYIVIWTAFWLISTKNQTP